MVQIHEFCDPFADAFLRSLTGPVTEGPFTNGQFSMFVPRVIDNVNGLLSLVAGGYGDPPPGPSGDGTLASVLFLPVGEGDPNIRLPTSVQINTGRILSTSLLKFLNPEELGL